MIREDVDDVRTGLEFGSPFLKAANDCHEFFIVNLIVAFSGAMFPQEERDWVENIVIVVLGKNSSGNVVGSICFNNTLLFWIEVPEDRGQGERVLEFLKADSQVSFHTNGIFFPVSLVKGETILEYLRMKRR